MSNSKSNPKIYTLPSLSYDCPVTQKYERIRKALSKLWSDMAHDQPLVTDLQFPPASDALSERRVAKTYSEAVISLCYPIPFGGADPISSAGGVSIDDVALFRKFEELADDPIPTMGIVPGRIDVSVVLLKSNVQVLVDNRGNGLLIRHLKPNTKSTRRFPLIHSLVGGWASPAVPYVEEKTGELIEYHAEMGILFSVDNQILEVKHIPFTNVTSQEGMYYRDNDRYVKVDSVYPSVSQIIDVFAMTHVVTRNDTLTKIVFSVCELTHLSAESVSQVGPNYDVFVSNFSISSALARRFPDNVKSRWPGFATIAQLKDVRKPTTPPAVASIDVRLPSPTTPIVPIVSPRIASPKPPGGSPVPIKAVDIDSVPSVKSDTGFPSIDRVDSRTPSRSSSVYSSDVDSLLARLGAFLVFGRHASDVTLQHTPMPIIHPKNWRMPSVPLIEQTGVIPIHPDLQAALEYDGEQFSYTTYIKTLANTQIWIRDTIVEDPRLQEFFQVGAFPIISRPWNITANFASLRFSMIWLHVYVALRRYGTFGEDETNYAFDLENLTIRWLQMTNHTVPIPEVEYDVYTPFHHRIHTREVWPSLMQRDKSRSFILSEIVEAMQEQDYYDAFMVNLVYRSIQSMESGEWLFSPVNFRSALAWMLAKMVDAEVDTELTSDGKLQAHRIPCPWYPLVFQMRSFTIDTMRSLIFATYSHLAVVRKLDDDLFHLLKHQLCAMWFLLYCASHFQVISSGSIDVDRIRWQLYQAYGEKEHWLEALRIDSPVSTRHREIVHLFYLMIPFFMPLEIGTKITLTPPPAPEEEMPPVDTLSQVDEQSPDERAPPKSDYKAGETVYRAMQMKIPQPQKPDAGSRVNVEDDLVSEPELGFNREPTTFRPIPSYTYDALSYMPRPLFMEETHVRTTELLREARARTQELREQAEDTSRKIADILTQPKPLTPLSPVSPPALSPVSPGTRKLAIETLVGELPRLG